MFLDKSQDAVIAVDQVGSNQIAVVITLNIDFTKDKIGTMGRTDVKNRLVGSEQHDSGQSDTIFFALRIASEETAETGVRPQLHT